MILIHSLLVAIGATLGALLRFQIGISLQPRLRGDFPWPTWLINASGTLLLGLCYRYFVVDASHLALWLLFGTGFCGAFTTFSTMSHEAVQLFRKKPLTAIVYVGSSAGFGIVLAFLTQWL